VPGLRQRRPGADPDGDVHRHGDPDAGSGHTDRHADDHQHAHHHADADRNGDRNAHRHLDVDADRHGYPDRHRDGDQHADAHADGDGHADADQHQHADAYRYADGYRDAERDGDQHGHRYQHGDGDRYRDADTDAHQYGDGDGLGDPDGERDGNGYADPDGGRYRHVYDRRALARRHRHAGVGRAAGNAAMVGADRDAGVARRTPMRLRTLMLLLVVAAPAVALPPANNEVTIQPTEIKRWACDYHVPVTTLVSHAVIWRAGSPADATCTTAAPEYGSGAKLCSPAGLITTPTISGNEAQFTITPTGKKGVYQVVVLVEDALGQRFSCDGKVTVATTSVKT
jgi:hypothetical protein